MIYLASPYSHDEPLVRTRRFLWTREFVWQQLQLGQPLFSPIVYCHQFARDFGAGIDADTWAHLNLPAMERASALWVLELPGWEESRGVAFELSYANRIGLQIEHKEPLPYATL